MEATIKATIKGPWKRFVLEGAVIVVGILLAFAVDVWWNRQQTPGERAVAVQGLRADFRQNQDRIRSTKARLVNGETRFEAFRSMTTDEVRRLQAHPDSAARCFVALWGASSFDSRDGTLDALLSAGRLKLVEDVTLRSLLVLWGHTFPNR